jgi:signal-transduction protein with cAMP-binding, CBS, and nucleotidyltransferase domain
MNTPVSRLIGPRGTIVHTAPTESVLSASKLMTAENTGSVLILDDSGSLIGIFTERDLLTRVVAADLDPAATPIETVMSKDVVTVRANALRRDVHNIMKAKNVRHVPILEDDEVVGVVSLRDILRSANAEKDFEIGQLRDYVTNRPYPAYPG